MKNKDYSKWLKFALVFVAFTLCILKWLGILPNASVTEIWSSAAAAYAIALGTMDYNIIRDATAERVVTTAECGMTTDGGSMTEHKEEQ